MNKEFTLSFGGEIGTKGFAKATYVRRKTTNIIDDFITATSAPRWSIRNGVNFGEYDNLVYRNADDSLFREYHAMVFQGRYRASRDGRRGPLDGADEEPRQLRGRSGESAGRAVALRRLPRVVLGRAELPRMVGSTTSSATRCAPGRRTCSTSGASARLDLSALWRYNSGLTYSLRATGEDLSDMQFARAEAAGYANEPNGGTQTIYFGERGTETFPSYGVADFSVGYSMPVFKTVKPYLKFEVLNAFNNQKLIGFDTTVSANWDGPVDALGIPTTFTRARGLARQTATPAIPRGGPAKRQPRVPDGGRRALLVQHLECGCRLCGTGTSPQPRQGRPFAPASRYEAEASIRLPIATPTQPLNVRQHRRVRRRRRRRNAVKWIVMGAMVLSAQPKAKAESRSKDSFGTIAEVRCRSTRWPRCHPISPTTS